MADPTCASQVGTVILAVVGSGIFSGSATFGVMKWVFGNQDKKIDEIKKRTNLSVTNKECDQRFTQVKDDHAFVRDDLIEKLDRVTVSLHGRDGVSGLVKTVHEVEFLVREIARKNGVQIRSDRMPT